MRVESGEWAGLGSPANVKAADAAKVRDFKLARVLCKNAVSTCIISSTAAWYLWGTKEGWHARAGLAGRPVSATSAATVTHGMERFEMPLPGGGRSPFRFRASCQTAKTAA